MDPVQALDEAIVAHLKSAATPREYGRIFDALRPEIVEARKAGPYDSLEVLDKAISRLKRAKRIVFVRKPVRGWVIA